MSTMLPLVWVVGDAMADVTVSAPTFRPTQEDPAVRVFPLPDPDRPGSYTLAPGGAANLAANLASLGCETHFLAVIDATRGFGPALVANLRKQSVRVTLVYPSGGDVHGTTTKIRFVTGTRLVGRVDQDVDSPGPVLPPLADPDRLPAAVVISDYGRGAVTKDSARSWVRWAHSRGVPVYADPTTGRQHIWDGTSVDVMVANWAEACGSRAGVRDIDAADNGWAKTLASSCKCVWGPFGAAVVKRGQNGSAWACKVDGKLETGVVPTVHPQQVFELQGAGDSYLAGLVAARCRGADLADACLFASAVAGVAVGKPGTAVVTLREAVEALKPVLATPQGVMTKDAAVAFSARLRAMGFSVGYSCGCFQHLTPGHVSTLTDAAAVCDFLFVGVDDDTRVRGLKGDVMVAEDDRVVVVAAVSGVGAAFLFTEDSGKIVWAIKPDVFVKSGYAADAVAGAEHLPRWGGRLLLVPEVAGTHNSTFFARIRGLT